MFYEDNHVLNELQISFLITWPFDKWTFSLNPFEMNLWHWITWFEPLLWTIDVFSIVSWTIDMFPYRIVNPIDLNHWYVSLSYCEPLLNIEPLLSHCEPYWLNLLPWTLLIWYCYIVAYWNGILILKLTWQNVMTYRNWNNWTIDIDLPYWTPVWYYEPYCLY